ncbi:MAG: rod shape-determining protein MreC [Opitutaceae bacterium]
MSFKRFAQAKPFATLGIFVAVWLVLPVAIKTFARATFFELTAPLTVAASSIRQLQEYWALRLHSKDQLIQAGGELIQRIESSELAVQRYAEREAEIARLENLLRLPAFTGYRSEHARVVRRDFNAWWHRIVIRKGKNFSIPVDAPVIFTGGVVGRVRAVHATTAEVDLISSPTVRLSGVIEGDPRSITFQGGLNPTFGPPTAIAEFVPLDILVGPTTPKRVVTSGFGGVFPPGLTLGTIVKVEASHDGLFRSGEVKLDERLGSLTEVTVLVPLNPD